MDPLVSVVIPSYNRAHVIAETLDSALAQTYPRVEIIVVDDGSKDDTEGAVAKYRDRIVFIRQQNQGLAAARNTGLMRSSGEYVAWLDSDDLWNSDKVAMQVAWMRKHPECVLVASDFSAFDDSGYFEASHLRSYYGVIDKTPGGLAGIFSDVEMMSTAGVAGGDGVAADMPAQVRVYSGDIYIQLSNGNCLHPPTVLFRRDAAMRAGLLEKRFRRDTDYEFLLRLSRQGRIALMDRPLMKYRYTEDQMSSDKHLADILLSRVLVLESLVEGDPTLRDNKAFRRRIGYAELMAAHAMADKQRGEAARHLVESLKWAYVDDHTARTVAKLCMPRWLVERVKK